MVVTHSFQEIFDASAKISSFNLPQHKESSLKIEFESSKVNKTHFNGSEPPLPFARSDIFHSSIIDWKRLTAVDRDCKAVYEFVFDIKGSNFSFKPGDTIGIVPQNIKTEVDYIIDHLNLETKADLGYTITIENDKNTKSKLPVHIPVKSTVRNVLTRCVDIRAVVKKLFILALSKYTKDERERKVLEYLCSKEGSSAYTTHILNTNICLLDLLYNFKSCKPPIEIIFQYLPRLLPRPYSIVNSPQKNPDVIKICFSVMDIGNNRKGLTTSWMESLVLGKNSCPCLEDNFSNLSITDSMKVPIYLRKNMNSFEIPEKIDSPLILIGPGTGVGPYIGFLDEIECRRKNCLDIHPIWLFFGCRNPKLDFIYRDKLKSFVESKVLTCLKTAFSRCENYQPKYVQDAIMDNGEDVIKLLRDGARVFVCGDTKIMATQVQEAIVNCLIKYDGITKNEAEKFVSDMQKDNSYIVDIWS